MLRLFDCVAEAYQPVRRFKMRARLSFRRRVLARWRRRRPFTLSEGGEARLLRASYTPQGKEPQEARLAAWAYWTGRDDDITTLEWLFGKKSLPGVLKAEFALCPGPRPHFPRGWCTISLELKGGGELQAEIAHKDCCTRKGELYGAALGDCLNPLLSSRTGCRVAQAQLQLGAGRAARTPPHRSPGETVPLLSSP